MRWRVVRIHGMAWSPCASAADRVRPASSKPYIEPSRNLQCARLIFTLISVRSQLLQLLNGSRIGSISADRLPQPFRGGRKRAIRKHALYFAGELLNRY